MKRIKNVFSLQTFARVAKHCVAGNMLLASCMLSGPDLEYAIQHIHSALCFSLIQSS